MSIHGQLKCVCVISNMCVPSLFPIFRALGRKHIQYNALTRINSSLEKTRGEPKKKISVCVATKSMKNICRLCSTFLEDRL